jgi:putative endonuclease
VKNPTNKITGDVGEAAAVQFLKNKGYSVVERNYRYERGEIDIIAENESELVFVEVKSRHSKAFGTPEDAVTEKKESYLKRTAEGYLFQHHLENRKCRFDVIAVEWKGEEPQIRHIKNVF